MFLSSFPKSWEITIEATKINYRRNRSIRWMKIIFWHPSIFNWPLCICCQDNWHWALHLLSLNRTCFKVAMIDWFIYWGVYVSPSICPSNYKAEPFSLTLNPYGINVFGDVLSVIILDSFWISDISKLKTPCPDELLGDWLYPSLHPPKRLAQSVGTVEITDCFSAEG